MSYKQFTRDDRVKLSVLLKTGMKNEAIGRILNKNPVSVWREIKRNGIRGTYLPSVAKKRSAERKTHRKRKIENDRRLKKYVLKKLTLYWSPEQIAGRLRRQHIIICPQKILLNFFFH